MKLFRHEGKVLRFKAKFANPKPEATKLGELLFFGPRNGPIKKYLFFGFVPEGPISEMFDL